MNDVAEIKRLIDNFYEIISGKAGEKRNWDSFKQLFFEKAHLIPVRFDINKNCITIPFDIDSYVLRLEGFLGTNDFFEYASNCKIEVYGNIAHAYSEYEAKTSINDVEPIKKGINIVQFINDGGRWKILNMLWQDK